MICRTWRVLVALAATMLVAVAAPAQMPEDYLDVLTAKVRPDKRAEFDALSKKVVDANRRNKGDTWIAMETEYGESNTVSFVSTRHSYGDAEKAGEAFVAALNKAYGQAGAEKLEQDFNNTLISSRGEFRRRRWDLSANVPADPAALLKLVGQSRWLRTTAVHVRTGHAPEVEAHLKELKTALEKTNPPQVTLVSQALAGQSGTVFYVTAPESSLGGFDRRTPTPQLLGEEGYRRFLKVAAESVQDTETVINHFLPELSNPPAEVTAAAPDFWAPKPKMAAKPKEGETTKGQPKKEE
jgi:hypothetical protein